MKFFYKKIGCLLYLLGLTCLCSAQLKFEQVVSLENGLLSNSITDIKKDSAGFIWFGTGKGLYRFDGGKLQTFIHQKKDSTSLSYDLVNTLLFDRSNRLWVGTNDGLNLFNPNKGNFKTYRHTNNEPNSLPSSRVDKIFEDRDGHLWLGVHAQGLVKFDDETDLFHSYKITPTTEVEGVDRNRINTINDIIQDSQEDSILWLATLAGLVRFNKNTRQYQQYIIELKDPDKRYRFNSLRRLYQHADGRIFFGSWGGAGIFDPLTKHLTPISYVPTNSTNPALSLVHAFVKKSEEELWITYDQGLMIFNTVHNEVVEVWFNSSINQEIYSVTYVDEAGRLWGGASQGLWLHDPVQQQFTHYLYSAPRDNFYFVTREVLETPDRQSLLVCVEGGDGLYVFDRRQKTWEVIPPPPDFLQKNTPFLGQDLIYTKAGQLLLLSYDKVYEVLLEEKKMKEIVLPIEEPSPFFRTFLQGQNGDFWIGSRRYGLFQVNQYGQLIRHFKEDLNEPGFESQYLWVEHLFENKDGNIFIRTASGFSIYMPEVDSLLNFPYRPELGNAFRNVKNFEEDSDGSIWVAGGEEGFGIVQPTRLGEGMVMDFNFPSSYLKKDAKGVIWLLNEMGLVKWDYDNHFNEVIEKEYGIPSSAHYLFQLSTGEMAIGRRRGISLFDPDKLHSNEEAPIPYLTSFKIFDNELGRDTNLLSIKDLSLSFNQNFFSIEFSAISYTMPKLNTFTYLLEGVDPDWVEAGQRQYAAYTNLDGGDYIFKLKAANGEGIESEKILQFNIHISTPWWKTWWFLSLLILGVLMLVLGSIYLRGKRIRAQERLAAKFQKELSEVKMSALRSQMNPHFIFNCLNSIDYYIITNETEKASDYLNRFSRLIRLILQNSRSDMVNLKDELEALRLYVEMESLRFDESFDYQIQVGKGLNLADIEIPPMLLQPYVENAIWHGLLHKKGKGRLDLTITEDNGILTCIIQDDGIGREAAQAFKTHRRAKKHSMGMKITQDRIEMLNQKYGSNGTVEILDLKDHSNRALGTRVELNLPLV